MSRQRVVAVFEEEPFLPAGGEQERHSRRLRGDVLEPVSDTSRDEYESPAEATKVLSPSRNSSSPSSR
jgi:hypothetical protein